MKTAIETVAAALAIGFTLSACASIEEAQNDRALAYFKAEEYDAAITIWSKLAEKGNARAQNNLGVMYEVGKGVEQDRELAMTLFRKSAAQNFGPAQANIGEGYYRGDGVPQDYEEAAHWYRLGALSGDNESQFYMGEMSAKGLGMPRDPVRAFVWYSFSAENKYEEAATALTMLSATLNETQRVRADVLLAECKALGLEAC